MNRRFCGIFAVMKLLVKIAVFVALSIMSITVLTGCVTEGNDDVSVWSLTEGDALPELSVVMSDGAIVDNSSIAGAVAVLVFFNTGCADCRVELPEVQKAYEMRGGTAKFVCIARQEGAASIESFWEENGLDLPFSPQPDRSVYNLFATVGIPRIYISDDCGVIRAVFSDTSMPSASDIVSAIDGV